MTFEIEPVESFPASAEQSAKRTTVSLIEDSPVLSRILRTVVNDSGRYRCVSMFEDAHTAVEGLTRHPAEIVVFDIGLPGGSGIECVRALRPIFPEMHFLAFTGCSDADSVYDALKAGACGYLLKGLTNERLLAALDSIVEGGSPLTAAISRTVLESFIGGKRVRIPLPSILTNRERQLLGELVRGGMLAGIARTMGVSAGTLHTHLRNLYRKLGVQSRPELMDRYFATKN